MYVCSCVCVYVMYACKYSHDGMIYVCMYSMFKNDNTFPVTLADDIEISPSTLFAVASILENCSYINGSPQNTFVPGQVNFKGRTEIIVDILNTYIHTFIHT